MYRIFGPGIIAYVIISMQFHAVAHLWKIADSPFHGDSAVVPGIPTPHRIVSEKISLLRVN